MKVGKQMKKPCNCCESTHTHTHTHTHTVSLVNKKINIVDKVRDGDIDWKVDIAVFLACGF